MKGMAKNWLWKIAINSAMGALIYFGWVVGVEGAQNTYLVIAWTFGVFGLIALFAKDGIAPKSRTWFERGYDFTVGMTFVAAVAWFGMIWLAVVKLIVLFGVMGKLDAKPE